jgi:hypothetical protein
MFAFCILGYTAIYRFSGQPGPVRPYFLRISSVDGGFYIRHTASTNLTRADFPEGLRVRGFGPDAGFAYLDTWSTWGEEILRDRAITFPGWALILALLIYPSFVFVWSLIQRRRRREPALCAGWNEIATQTIVILSCSTALLTLAFYLLGYTAIYELTAQNSYGERSFLSIVSHSGILSLSHSEPTDLTWSTLPRGQPVTDYGPIGGFSFRNSLTSYGTEIRKVFELTSPGWALILALLIYPLVVFLRGPNRRRRRRRLGRCVPCGYNLTGNVTGRCPECGTEIET